MEKFRKTLFFIFLSQILAPWAYADLIGSTCQEIIVQSNRNENRPLDLRQLLKIALQDDSIIELNQFDGFNFFKVLNPPIKHENNEKVFVFSLGKQSLITDADRQWALEFRWYRQFMNRNFARLAEERTVQDCEKVARTSLNLSNDLLKEYARQFDHWRFIHISDVAKDLSKVDIDLRRTTKVIGYNDFKTEVPTEIKKLNDDLLNSWQGPKNLVFIFDGGANGILSGTNGQIIERTAFNFLLDDPDLKSVTIFSCYPEQVAKFYSKQLKLLHDRGIKLYFPKNTGALEGFKKTPFFMFRKFFFKKLTDYDLFS